MIVVFGSINLDLIFPLPNLPRRGETALAPVTLIQPGGKGANQAVAAARDGAQVVLAGAVGTDALADSALAGLDGIDISRVVRTPRAGTGCAAVLVDMAGHNAIAVGAGANALADPAQIEDKLLRPGTTLLLQLETPVDAVATLIRRARARRARIVLNLAPCRPLPEAALRAVDLLLVNETEAAALAARFGAPPDAAGLHAVLGIAVIRTCGDAGAELADAGGARRMPAFPVEAVDTTAAGDCFAGVLGAALDRGEDLPAACRRAAAAAALACTRRGSQSSLPWAAETDAVLASAAQPDEMPDDRPGGAT